MPKKFDAYLAQRKPFFSAVGIGGAALAILGIISRETQDCDVLDPGVPEDIKKAAQDFSKAIVAEGSDLKEDWLNYGAGRAGLRIYIPAKP